MKISIVTTGYLPELNGATTSLYKRLKILSRFGYKVQLFIPDYSVVSNIYTNCNTVLSEYIEGLSIVKYRSKPLFGLNGGACSPKFFSFKEIERQINLFKPDIIHIEEPERLFIGFLSVPGINCARKLKIPVTAFYHTNYLEYISDYKEKIPFLRIPFIERILQRIVISVYNKYTMTMVPAKNTQEKLLSFGIKNSNLDSYLGIDTSLFKKIDTRESLIDLHLKFKNKIKIIFVGRMYPDKQLDILVQIFDSVRKKTDRCCFIVAGSGPEGDRVKGIMEKYNDTAYLGYIPNEELPKYYSFSDIFLTASNKENYPLTILEAMACGLPVIGPKEGGVGEMIINENNGLSVEAGNIEKFTAAIIRLVDDRELLTKLSQNVINHVKNKSWEDATLLTLKTWESLIIQSGSFCW